MKRTKNLLLMCGVLVILALAYIIIVTLTEKSNENNPGDTDAPINTSYTAAKLDIATVYSINYNLGDVRYSFSLNDSESAWLWDESEDLPLDNAYFAAMASALETVTSSVKLTGRQSSLAEYGLDSPWLTVTVSDEVNGVQTFMFGDFNSFNSRYYFMSGAEAGIVYMADRTVASPFDYTPYEMVKNDELPQVPSGSIRRLTLKSSADQWVYTYYENGKDALSDTADLWYVSKNGGAEETLAEETALGLSDAITSISFSDIAGYSSSDQKKLGLDDPTVMTISYVAETSVTNDSGVPVNVSVDSTLTLNLGYSDGNGKLYAALPSSPLSYRIEGTLLAALYNAIILPASE